MRQLDFIRESNRIEGIMREPTTDERKAHAWFLQLSHVGVGDLESFVSTVAGKGLRRHAGMDVRVGPHVPTPGGQFVENELVGILAAIERGDLTPWEAHVAYETLHPFMDGNGRSGRVLWAWQMQKNGRDPFALPFLHRFYYDTLAESQR